MEQDKKQKQDFANFAVDNKILNHYNMKAKVVDNRYLFF